MPDRYGSPSSSGRFGPGGDPWFRVGQIDVTTTVAVVGMGVISMVVWAIEGTAHELTQRLLLISDDVSGIGSVLSGEIWRLVTWPLVNDPDIWTIILFAVFYMLGNQLEALMGRRPFMFFLLALTLIPAVLVTVLELVIPGFLGSAFGLRFVELGVLVAFAAQYPTARFWPGIPAWGIAAVIVGLDFLQALGERNDYQFAMLLAVIVTALLGIRAFGFANELLWLPKLSLPGSITGTSAAPRRPRQQRSKKRRGRGSLSAVPGPPVSSVSDRRTEMEIDALLDQVAESGLDSLSKEQRKRLEDHSKQLRKKRDQ